MESNIINIILVKIHGIMKKTLKRIREEIKKKGNYVKNLILNYM